MAMYKLLHIITDTNTGGAGVLLLNQLKHFDRGLFDISVVLPRGSELKEKTERLGYPVIETKHGADRSFETGAVAGYIRLMRAERPDIVHCHGALSARIAAMLTGVPVRIHTRHCAYPPSALMRSFPLRRILGGVNNMLSTGIVAVADAAADDLLALGTDPELITVIINGVEPLERIDNAAQQAVRERLGFTKNDFVAGIFARLEECKGHRYLLEALALAGPDSRIRLLICGKGSAERRLRDMAELLGVSDRVVFAGFCEDIAPYMNAVDVNVNCSVGTETSSLALSEGMSVGKPCVVSDYGGNPAMVEDGVTGFVVPSADPAALSAALGRLDDDRQLLHDMGRAAYSRYLTKFTAGVMTAQLEALYLRQLEAARGKKRKAEVIQ